MDNTIIQLLSNQRDPKQIVQPTSLNKTQIVSLIKKSISPNELQATLDQKINDALEELEAKGEILLGTRNRYCIAPPSVLCLEKNNLSSLFFQGDRAYLLLAHRVLKTYQNPEEISLHTRLTTIDEIQHQLNQVGIRFFTLEESLDYLPKPCPPSVSLLRSPLQIDPFENGKVEQYIPSQDTVQKERWKTILKSNLINASLLRLVTKEYLWFQDNKYYEIEPKLGTLLMFYLDQKTQFPLKINWDKLSGKLPLQGVFLPLAYYRLILQLSKPDEEHYRTRCIPPNNAAMVETAFKKLGCILS